MRILLVEADPAIARRLEEGLRHEGLAVRVVAAASAADADVTVTVIGLPDGDRLALCRGLRASDSRRRILMLTPDGSEPHRVAALEAGADDALGRDAVSSRELAARVRALGRRRGGSVAEPPAVVVAGPLRVDVAGRGVELDGAGLRPSRTELELVLQLAAAPDRVLGRETLTVRIWGEGAVDARTLDSVVKRLRRRLGPAGERIETVRGVGYRLRVKDRPATVARTPRGRPDVPRE